jgi:hypothetical protein
MGMDGMGERIHKSVRQKEQEDQTRVKQHEKTHQNTGTHTFAEKREKNIEHNIGQK